MSTDTLNTKTPPGTQINPKNVTITPLGSQITFSFNSTSVKPLPPLAQVSFSADGNLLVSNIVFLPASENAVITSVYQESVISDEGTTQLDFFIDYDAPEESFQTFNAVRVDLIIENPPADLEQIETYLWDEDPESSRGTITEVK